MNATAEDILTLLTEGRITPGYAAGELDKGQPYVSRLLSQLVDEGYVTKIDRGLYEITPEGNREVLDVGDGDGAEDGGGGGDALDDEPATREDDPEAPTADGGTAFVEEPDTGKPLEDMVAALELEGAGTTLEIRENALVEIVERLREDGAVDVTQLKAILDEYDHGYEDADAAWANFRRQDVFAELPVETPGQGGRKYRYEG